MSRPRFLADHDFTEVVLHGLLRREPAVEVVRAREVGADRVPDDDVLAFAAAEGLVVLSHDVNTMSAAAVSRLGAGRPMAGLILVHQLAPVARVIEDLLIVWACSEAEEWPNRVRFVPF